MEEKKAHMLKHVEYILMESGCFDRKTIQKSLNVLRGAGEAKPEKEKMISAKDVMTLLDCSRPYLYTLERAGKLHPVKYSPRKLAYHEDEVLELKYGKTA